MSISTACGGPKSGSYKWGPLSFARDQSDVRTVRAPGGQLRVGAVLSPLSTTPSSSFHPPDRGLRLRALLSSSDERLPVLTTVPDCAEGTARRRSPSTTVRSEALPVASNDVDLGVSAEDGDSALRVDFSEVLAIEQAGRRVRRARDQQALRAAQFDVVTVGTIAAAITAACTARTESRTALPARPCSATTLARLRATRR